MTKAKKRAAPASRFDGEALGLVLFALSLFLLLTLILPLSGLGVMATLKNGLLRTLAWGSYTLPAIPLCYAVLAFWGRSARALTWRTLGGAITVISLLSLQSVFSDQAGELAALLTRPLRPLSYLAALAPLCFLTIGLEIVLNMRLFSLLKGFFRGLSLLLGKLLQGGQVALERGQERQRRSGERGQLRQGYAAHLRDLQALKQLHPESPELDAWQQEAKAAHKELRRLSESKAQEYARELDYARSLQQSYARSAAHAFAQELSSEAPPEALEAETLLGRIQGGQHELGQELGAQLVSGPLDRARRRLVMDLQRLCDRLSALERERQRALADVAEPSAASLLRQHQAHERRLQQWQQAAEGFREWQELAGHYAGWPALAAAFDAGPPPLAEEVARALRSSPESTLADLSGWTTYARAGGVLGGTSDTAFAASENPVAEITQYLADWAPPRVTAQVRAVATSQRPASNVAVMERSSASPLFDAPPWEGEDTRIPSPAPRRPTGALDLALPGESLLDPIPRTAANAAALDTAARQRAGLINETLAQFGLSARVVDFARGPTVTRYEIEPAPGEKISRIASLSNDLARALAVGGVRVEAPVPGKSVIGLEVPNAEREPVTFHSALSAPAWKNSRAKLPIILGKSIDGELVVGDLAKMPHLLIAGSTGSGKSVCVNTLITSLLYRYLPTELRFLMIDPKMVELTPYDGIPHLVRGVVTNPMDAAGVLLGAVAHMEQRYKMMSQVGAKNLEQFNAKMRQVGEAELPHLVIIIDELADLMITSPKEVESAIMRLAQMARATGMHLVLATQRPSVDILTSLIKVNVPARIAFAVSSSHDSRTILDSMGAERLTGMGDMLFYQPGLVKPVRLQGPYISEGESARITDELRRQVFDDHFAELYGADFDGAVHAEGVGPSHANMDFSDPYLRQAAEICIDEGQGSVSRLQRRLSVGHARAGKLMDMLEAMGIVSKHQGSKPREVLINREDLPEYFGK